MTTYVLIPDKVDVPAHLDALVPGDGESRWHLVNDEERQWYLDVDAHPARRRRRSVRRPHHLYPISPASAAS
jgi:hypothetical protein